MEHLTANPHMYLSNIRRVLKKGGSLVLTTPNAAHLKNRANALLGNNISFSLQQLAETRFDDDSIYHRHNREFTMDELTTILQQESFTIDRAEYVSFYTPSRPGYPTSLVQRVGYGITRMLPSLRDSLLVVATT